MNAFFIRNMTKFEFVISTRLNNSRVAKIKLRCIQIGHVFLVCNSSFNTFGQLGMLDFLVTINNVHNLFFQVFAEYIHGSLARLLDQTCNQRSDQLYDNNLDSSLVVIIVNHICTILVVIYLCPIMSFFLLPYHPRLFHFIQSQLVNKTLF